jgi:hypothetical protein
MDPALLHVGREAPFVVLVVLRRRSSPPSRWAS